MAQVGTQHFRPPRCLPWSLEGLLGAGHPGGQTCLSKPLPGPVPPSLLHQTPAAKTEDREVCLLRAAENLWQQGKGREVRRNICTPNMHF